MYAYMSYIPSLVPEMNVADGPDTLTIDAGLSSHTFNFICKSRLSNTPSPVQSVKQGLAQFSGRDVSWWTAPSCTPENLPHCLKSAGLSFVSHYPGMALNLREHLKTAPVTEFTIREVTIREVTTPEDAQAFGQVAGQVYDEDPHPGETFYKRGFECGLDTDTFKMYLGIWNERPVSTCIAFYHSGLVGIYSVATLMEAQKRGFGKAIVQAALHEAAKSDVQTAILQSSAQGRRLYEKMGFHHICNFDMWIPVS